MDNIPFTVVGGGICGVMLAWKLQKKFPELDVLLIEKESYIGHHNTTRNSGVLHAGIYYPTGSNKHLLCIDGYNQWLVLAQQLDIPINICGKYIIATEKDELSELDRIYNNAIQNNVLDIRMLTSDEINDLRDITNIKAGFYSPRTGILDASSAINSLRDEFLKLQGILLMNSEVAHIENSDTGFTIQVKNYTFTTDNLFNCAGAWSVSLRNQLGLTDVENYFVKGNYLKLNKPYYNKKLIYPVPPKNLSGLGVHTSFHIDGIIRFGPNTEVVESVTYSNSEKNIDIMYPLINEKFKNIRKEDLSLDYVGVRTKILKDKKLQSDFLLQGPQETKVKGYYELLGIESPGLTAAPAIADRLLAMITPAKNQK
jgi:L-2-hydroxyglutarate oxidase LhgO